MSFMNWIIQELNNLSSFFYSVYLEVSGWIYPFNLAAGLFYQICLIFNQLAWHFYNFSVWVDAIWFSVQQLGIWESIRKLIISWLPNLEDVTAWFSNWLAWVSQTINEWWSATSIEVQYLINVATTGLTELIAVWNNFTTTIFPQWTNLVNALTAAWNEFWAQTLPNLVNFIGLTDWWSSQLKEIDTLIDTWFKTFSPFWEGWQEIKDDVYTFFTDPLKWLYDRLEDFIDRYW